MESKMEVLNLTHVIIKPETINDAAELIIPRIRPQWCLRDLTIQPLTGGNANQLYQCYMKHDQNDKIIFRIHGPIRASIINRDDELDMMVVMNRAGLGPPVYCKFQNGICYGFVPGIQADISLNRQEIYWRPVAELMAKLHSLDPTQYCHTTRLMDRPNMSEKMFAFINLIPDSMEPRCKEGILTKEELITETKSLLKHLDGLGLRRALCHNDLNTGNIIFNQDTGSVTFIDWENCGVNYVAYDIAAYFGFFSNTESLFPPKDLLIRFLKAYLHQRVQLEGTSPESVTDVDVETLYIQVFLLNVVLFSLTVYHQSTDSKISLNHARFGTATYLACREELLALKLPQ